MGLFLLLLTLCLPPGIAPEALEPVLALQYSRVHTPLGEPILAQIRRSPTLISVWVGARLVAIDPDPGGPAPLWLDRGQWAVPMWVIRETPGACQWERWDGPEKDRTG